MAENSHSFVLSLFFFYFFFEKNIIHFTSAKNMIFSILLDVLLVFFYLCKDFPLKIFLENIWRERKKYLPLQPQTRNKRPSQ